MTNESAHKSICDIGEIPLVRHLLEDWHWGSPFRNALRAPEGSIYLPEVSLAGIGTGDIDILAVNPHAPHESLAISVKIIKVSEKSFKTGKPNKLKKLRTLKKQTNDLVDLGFWKVCACIITTIDSRINNVDNPDSLDGMNENIESLVREQIAAFNPYKSAGILHIQLIQPTECEPLTTGYISAEIIRAAESAKQPEKINRFVSLALNSKG